MVYVIVEQNLLHVLSFEVAVWYMGRILLQCQFNYFPIYKSNWTTLNLGHIMPANDQFWQCWKINLDFGLDSLDPCWLLVSWQG